MSFSFLPVWAVVTGAFALVALLFLLQRLRAQPTVHIVASIQLWQDAMQQNAARSFWQRFRYWLAFLTAVLISLLLWFTLNGLTLQHDTKTTELYYLDTSAAMLIADNMSNAKAQLVRDLDTASANNRELWIGDAVPARLLNQDTPSALLKPYLSGIVATTHLSSFQPWLDQMSERYPDRPLVVHYYGPVHSLADSSPLIEVRPAFIARATETNTGITALGLQHDTNGTQQFAHVAFSVFNSEQKTIPVSDVTVLLNDKALASSRIVEKAQNHFEIAEVLLTDAPQTLAVAIQSDDAFPADDQAFLTLPAQTQIRIALSAGLPSWVSHYVDANPILKRDGTNPQVSICQFDALCLSADATLYLTDRADTAHFYTTSAMTETQLTRVWHKNHWTGSDSPNAMPAFEVTRSDRTWAELPLNRLSRLLAQQVPDPLILISYTIQWLIAMPVTPPYVAVGEQMPLLQSASYTGHNPIAGVPLHAGKTPSYGVDAALFASLQSPELSLQVAQKQAESPSDNSSASTQLPWITGCGLLILLLLVAEWLMIQRGRWP